MVADGVTIRQVICECRERGREGVREEKREEGRDGGRGEKREEGREGGERRERKGRRQMKERAEIMREGTLCITTHPLPEWISV